MGVDLRCLRPVRGLHAASVLSAVLGGLLRRGALRDERRLAGDGARSRPARVPQLVSASLPLCLRLVPVRDERVGTHAFAAELAETLARNPRQISSKYF